MHDNTAIKYPFVPSAIFIINNDVAALGLDPQAVYEKAKEASAACKV
ncbi:hypothetical protein ACS8FA_04420 [Psychrobacter sp. 1Y1]